MADENLAAKFSIDITDLKTGLSQANRLIKESRSEFKAAAAGMDDWTKSEEGLTAKIKSLTDVQELQQTKVNALKAEYQRLVDDGLDPTSKEAVELRTKINDEEAALAKTTKELDDNKSALATLDGGMEDAEKSTEGFGKEVKKSADEANKSGKVFQSLGKVCEDVGKVIAGAFAALGTAATATGKALVDASKSGAAYADDVLTQSTVTGIATDKLQEYKYAAELVDVSTETLTGSMAKNIKSMTSASSGTGAAAEAYKKLGVSVTDSNGNLRDSETVYWELIDALGKVPNETERDALAMQVLGKSAQDLNPLIEAGGKKMTELGEQAREAGYILGDDALNAFGAFDDQMQFLSVGADAAKNAIGGILLPALTDLAGDGKELLGEFTSGVNSANGDMSKIGDVIGNTLKKAIEKINEYLPRFMSMATNIALALVNGIAQAAPMLGDTIAVFTQAIADALPDFIYAIYSITHGIINALPQVIEAIISALPEILPALINGTVGLIYMLVEELPNIIQPIIDNLPEIIKSVVETLLKQLDNLIDAAIQLVLGIVNASDQIVTALIPMIPTIITEVVGAIIKAIPTLIRGVLEVTIELVKFVKDWFTSWVEGFPAAFKHITSTFSDWWEGFKENIIYNFEVLKNNVKEKFEAIKNSISEKLDSAKEKVQTVFSDIKSDIKDKIDSIKENVQTKFDEIKEKITQPVQDAKDKVKEIVDKLKGMFDFEWKLPHIKLPHLSMTPGEAPYGIGGKGHLPTFDIQWLKNGGIVTQATNAIIGEDGPEAVIPLKNNTEFLDYLAEKLNEKHAQSVVINQTNNYSQAHSRYELYKSKQQTMAAVRLAMQGG